MKRIVMMGIIVSSIVGFAACSSPSASKEKATLEQDMKVGDSTLEVEHKLIEDAQAKMESDHKAFVAKHAKLNEPANSAHNVIEQQHQKLLDDHKALLAKHETLVENHKALEKKHEAGNAMLEQISADHAQMMKDHAQMMADHQKIETDFDKMMHEDGMIKEQDSTKLSKP